MARPEYRDSSLNESTRWRVQDVTLGEDELTQQLVDAIDEAIVSDDDEVLYEPTREPRYTPKYVATSPQQPVHTSPSQPQVPPRSRGVFSNAADTISLNPVTGQARRGDGTTAGTMDGRDRVDSRRLVANEAVSTGRAAADRTVMDGGVEGDVADDYDHMPDRLETIAHAGLLLVALGLVLAFSHWNYVQALMSSGTLMLASMVLLYNLFMRRREHRAVQTLLVIWILWLLYGVLVFGYQYTVSSAWVRGLRDFLLTVQVVVLVTFRTMPLHVAERDYGVRIMARASQMLGQERVNAVDDAFHTMRQTVTEHIPRRLDSLTNGTSVQMGRHLERDCLSTVDDFRNNAGIRFLSCDSRIGFIVYELLLTLPLVDNNPVAYNPYWTAARITLSWALYKLVDDIYRPRMPNAVARPSAPTIVSVSQFVLYANPYLAVVLGTVLLVVLSCVCRRVRKKREDHAHTEAHDCDLGVFEDPAAADEAV